MPKTITPAGETTPAVPVVDPRSTPADPSVSRTPDAPAAPAAPTLSPEIAALRADPGYGYQPYYGDQDAYDAALIARNKAEEAYNWDAYQTKIVKGTPAGAYNPTPAPGSGSFVPDPNGYGNAPIDTPGAGPGTTPPAGGTTPPAGGTTPPAGGEPTPTTPPAGTVGTMPTQDPATLAATKSSPITPGAIPTAPGIVNAATVRDVGGPAAIATTAGAGAVGASTAPSADYTKALAALQGQHTPAMAAPAAAIANDPQGLQALQDKTQAVQGQVTHDATVQGQLNSILSNGSPLLEAAKARAMQQAASRGLVNSSMAAQAGEEAVVNAAMPIAQQDAATFQNQNIANQDVQNLFIRDKYATSADIIKAYETYKQSNALFDKDATLKAYINNANISSTEKIAAMNNAAGLEQSRIAGNVSLANAATGYNTAAMSEANANARSYANNATSLQTATLSSDTLLSQAATVANTQLQTNAATNAASITNANTQASTQIATQDSANAVNLANNQLNNAVSIENQNSLNATGIVNNQLTNKTSADNNAATNATSVTTAQMQKDASKYNTDVSASTQKDVANIQGQTQRDVANIGAKASTDNTKLTTGTQLTIAQLQAQTQIAVTNSNNASGMAIARIQSDTTLTTSERSMQLGLIQVHDNAVTQINLGNMPEEAKKNAIDALTVYDFGADGHSGAIFGHH